MKKIKKTGAVEIYSNKTSDKLSSQYSIDVVDELSKLLSEQIAREIDIEILKSLGIELEKNKRRKNSIDKIYKKTS